MPMPEIGASDGALLVAMEHGIDLGAHRARPLTRDLVSGADLVLAMGERHLARVDELGGTGKAFLLTDFASNGERVRGVATRSAATSGRTARHSRNSTTRSGVPSTGSCRAGRAARVRSAGARSTLRSHGPPRVAKACARVGRGRSMPLTARRAAGHAGAATYPSPARTARP
jgi:protein-tyrosine-phosphatase